MTVTTSPHANSSALPVWPLVIEAHRLFLVNLAALVRTAFTWICLFLAIVAPLYWFLWPAEVASWNRPNAESLFLVFLTLAISTLAGSSLAIAWHRFILLGERLPGPGYVRLDGIVKTYFAVALIYTLWFTLPLLVLGRDTAYRGPSDFDTAIAITTLILAVWMITRLLMLLPAISLDRTDATMETAWLWSQGSFWRLLAGTILTSIVPLSLLGAIIIADPAYVLGPPDDRIRFVVTSCIYEVVGLISGMLTSGYFALAYRELARGEEAP